LLDSFPGDVTDGISPQVSSFDEEIRCLVKVLQLTALSKQKIGSTLDDPVFHFHWESLNTVYSQGLSHSHLNHSAVSKLISEILIFIPCQQKHKQLHSVVPEDHPNILSDIAWFAVITMRTSSLTKQTPTNEDTIR
jgi:hypothetical protein